MSASQSIRIPQKARDADGVAVNLPRPLTSFVGRQDEIAAIRRLITRDDVRLLTLTGPGGIGKTRLALQVAQSLAETSIGAIEFVPLASIRDPELVPALVARTLGVANLESRSSFDRLYEVIKDTPILLVLDNLEHLPDLGLFVADLLEHCPALTILGTSRKRLDVSGEHVFPLPPLTPSASLDLFYQRANAIAPDFAETAENVATVAEICQRLDSLPLAIELAAARIPVLPPHALFARLDGRLKLLTGGYRDAPIRHQGLRQAIAWSHDLLNLVEQVLFRRLGIFVGSFSLEAAGAIAGGGEDVLDGVSSLVASSLLERVPGMGDESRFVMLETIREYALERLNESGEVDSIHRRHAAYYMEIARLPDMIWWLPEGVGRLNQLETEFGNIRAVFEWLEFTGDMESVLQLAGALGPLWTVRGHNREGLRITEAGLPGSPKRIAGRVGIAHAHSCLDPESTAGHNECPNRRQAGTRSCPTGAGYSEHDLQPESQWCGCIQGWGSGAGNPVPVAGAGDA